MQTAEAAAQLAVLAHGVGDAGAGVHAGERGSDEGEEDGGGLEEHEGAAVAGAEEGVADDDHHVADGSGGAGGALHAVAAVEEVVGGEVLEEVEDDALHQQRGEDGDGDVALGVLGLTAHGGDGLEADQDQDRDGRLDEDPGPFVRADDGLGGGMGEEVAGWSRTRDRRCGRGRAGRRRRAWAGGRRWRRGRWCR